MVTMAFRAEVVSEVEIAAPPAVVWAVLVDLESYPRWNPFTTEVISRLQPGSPVDMQVVLTPGRPARQQREYVTQRTREQRLCWGVTFGLAAIMRAERCQTLAPLANDHTRYRTVDRLRGVLVPLVMRLYGESMQRGFDGVAQGLKREAEARASEVRGAGGSA